MEVSISLHDDGSVTDYNGTGAFCEPVGNVVGMHDSRFHGRHHGSNDLDWELVNMDDDDW